VDKQKDGHTQTDMLTDNKGHLKLVAHGPKIKCRVHKQVQL